MGLITDTISITEIARLTNKSRPTIYKWLTLYYSGDKSELPAAVAELFDLIAESGSKKEIYTFCDGKFYDKKDDGDLKEIVELIKDNKAKLDLNRIREFIEKEIDK